MDFIGSSAEMKNATPRPKAITVCSPSAFYKQDIPWANALLDPSTIKDAWAETDTSRKKITEETFLPSRTATAQPLWAWPPVEITSVWTLICEWKSSLSL